MNEEQQLRDTILPKETVFVMNKHGGIAKSQVERITPKRQFVTKCGRRFGSDGRRMDQDSWSRDVLYHLNSPAIAKDVAYEKARVEWSKKSQWLQAFLNNPDAKKIMTDEVFEQVKALLSGGAQ
jgi:hypothetical protein